MLAKLPHLTQLHQPARPAECLLEAFVVERLDEIIQGGELEGAQCVLIERGNEDRRRHGVGADLAHDVEPRLAWHLHVEKHEVRLSRPDGLDCRHAIVRGADDLDAGLVGEQVDDPLAREHLVVDNEHVDWCVSHVARQAMDTAAVRKSARVW